MLDRVDARVITVALTGKMMIWPYITKYYEICYSYSMFDEVPLFLFVGLEAIFRASPLNDAGERVFCLAFDAYTDKVESII